MWYVNGIAYNTSSITQDVVAIDAVTQLGYDIPRFCYHEGLKIAGNCRMCLVEDIKAAKPVVSCAMGISVDLSIFLNTTKVKKARESVMEFLLINHPLDCPICDQGGECDLQDLALVYGSDHGRFYEYKRNIEDKNCGSIVKTVMNRCILCTRCVRFANDVARFTSFGLTGRGVKSEIGSYVENIIDTELSGNLVDVCPVGALTSKPYSFLARPWELKRIFTLNILDDEIQKIRVDAKENELLRILPSKNSAVINHWITNRVRFSYEGLSRAREASPLILGAPTTWTILLGTMSELLNRLTFTKAGSITTQAHFNVFDTTLSNQDVIFLKNLVNATASPYTVYNNRHVKTFLSPGYDTILDTTGCTFWVINLDLEFSSPVLHLLLKQHAGCIISWYSSPISAPENRITIQGAADYLLKALRSKTWHSLLPVRKILLTSAHLDLSLSRFNPIVVFSSAALRAKMVFGFAAKTSTRSTSCLQSSTISYSIAGPNSVKSANAALNISQSTHLKNCFTESSSFVLPYATPYEQSNLEYFDTSYRIHKTCKTITNSFKTGVSVLKAVSSTLGLTLSSDVYSGNTQFAKEHITFSIFLTQFVALTTFSRMPRSAYYSAYFLTQRAPTLRIIEQKNIYLH